MRIIRAKPQDADALTRIALSAKRHWGYPESWIESWREILTVRPESILRHEVQLADIDGAILGFYTLAFEGGKLHLGDLFVAPEAMKKGIGRLLFIHALKRAKEKGFTTIEIESDPNAEGFYLRMGARRVTSRMSESAEYRRELPLLVCHVDAADANSNATAAAHLGNSDKRESE